MRRFAMRIAVETAAEAIPTRDRRPATGRSKERGMSPTSSARPTHATSASTAATPLQGAAFLFCVGLTYRRVRHKRAEVAVCHVYINLPIRP
jgi:hypothetical protein